MSKTRGFEVAKGFEDKDIHLPVRKTKYAAGYDIEAAEDWEALTPYCTIFQKRDEANFG